MFNFSKDIENSSFNSLKNEDIFPILTLNWVKNVWYLFNRISTINSIEKYFDDLSKILFYALKIAGIVSND